MSKTAEPYTAPYFTDYVGRRRKLSAGAIKSICRQYEEGTRVDDLAYRFGVSQSLIRTVTWHTARKVEPPRRRPEEPRPGDVE